MKDLPISKKLFITFGVILGLFVITVVLSVFSLFSTGGNFDKFYEEAYQINIKADELKISIQTVAKNIGYSMMENDVDKTAQYVLTAQENIQILRDGTIYMKENFQGDRSLIDKYDSVMTKVKDDRDKVFELAKNNQNEEAIELYFNNVMPGFIEANGYLEQIGAAATQTAEVNYNSAKAQKNVITVILLVLSVITLGVTVFLASYIIRGITEPIRQIENAARKMAEGSLEVQIAYTSKDEMGSLADSMRSLTGSLRRIINDIGRILTHLGDGDFHVTSECADLYVGDYVPILLSMRQIRDRLNETMHQILEASNQVAAGAGQMAQSAQGLAEGATEQAGAVEELTATIEDVANMSEQTSVSAKEAYSQIKTSAQKAEDDKKEMEQLILAMERISETSKEIENIITAIEDIASQTNLLSLNASIEAARAGEAGRGFAVVADQIGKLAADSAQSAVNTKELIIKTLDEIEEGSQITNKTSKAFDMVIEEMKTFAEVAKESSEKSVVQFESLNQVKAGIEQISSVVQNNSAAAQETSATSEELSAQADNLENEVSRFKLLN